MLTTWKLICSLFLGAVVMAALPVSAAAEGLTKAEAEAKTITLNKAIKGDKSAFQQLLSDANSGDGGAQYALGGMYFDGQGVPQNYTTAAQWYQKAADQGIAGAQFVIGWMYEEGKGVPQNYTAAVQWSKKAADQGHAGAQANLGVMYKEGNGVPQNYAIAIQWFKKAADQGENFAQAHLGAMYEDGRGVQRDYQEAMKWYIIAKANGYSDDAHDLQELKAYATKAQIAQAQKLADKWFAAHQSAK